MVVQYTPHHKEQWDHFVDQSRNGTFHVKRDFIEYHGDRFIDRSVLVFNDQNKLVMLLAAHQSEKGVASHLGLTYAGFILDKMIGLDENLRYFREVTEYFIAEGFEKFYYKTIPHIYHRNPGEDDLVFLFALDAQLKVRHVSPVIDLKEKLPYQERRLRAIKKAVKNGVTYAISPRLSEYWKLLEELLAVYDSRPVHSLDEIQMLVKAFPNEIKLYVAEKDGDICAGILVFESQTVAKFQYIASSLVGKEMGALDGLTDFLIQDIYREKEYIDFGTSTLAGGRKISMGISRHKEGFGARTTIHDQYEIDLKNVNWTPFEHLLS